MDKARDIHYTSDFQKSYKRLPRSIQNIVDRKDTLFRENPFHSTLHTHKLHGPLDGFWSFWITREYHVLFEFTKDHVIFYDIGTHKIYQ